MKRIGLAAACILFALLALAAHPQITSKPGTLPQEGAAAPEFAAGTVDGRNVSLADYRGKFVLLVFWSPG